MQKNVKLKAEGNLHTTDDKGGSAMKRIIRYFRDFYAHCGGAVIGYLLLTIVHKILAFISPPAAQRLIDAVIGGSGFVPAFIGNVPKLVTSVPNTIIAVVVAMALLPALQKALSHTSFGREHTQTAEK